MHLPIVLAVCLVWFSVSSSLPFSILGAIHMLSQAGDLYAHTNPLAPPKYMGLLLTPLGWYSWEC